MSQALKNNLKAKYENEINIAKTNIEMFLASPQGVAEHIDFAETVEKELEKIAHAHDMLEALELIS
jgi:hypothetical protein